MDAHRLAEILREDAIVRLNPEQHAAVASLVTPEPDLQLGFPCDLSIVRREGQLAALERSRPDEWVLRPLATEDEARAFLERRRQEYDRMWDGCGCAIDYYR
jgi:hypothetical protein